MLLSQENINWYDISIKLDFTNIRILEQIYNPKATTITLVELSKRLKKYKINKMKCSRRLRDLEKMGLISIIKKTNPLCIWGLWEIEDKINFRILESKRLLRIE